LSAAEVAAKSARDRKEKSQFDLQDARNRLAEAQAVLEESLSTGGAADIKKARGAVRSRENECEDLEAISRGFGPVSKRLADDVAGLRRRLIAARQAMWAAVTEEELREYREAVGDRLARVLAARELSGQRSSLLSSDDDLLMMLFNGQFPKLGDVKKTLAEKYL